MRSPWITLRPTPPTPKTAAVSPGRTLARLSTAPTPVSTPQPMRQAEDSGTSLGMRTACTSLTTVSSEKTEAAAKLEAGSPLKVNGVEMLPSELLHQVGWPVLQARQAPQLARVAITTWSPGFTERTASPTASTMPGALVAEHGRRRERDGPVDDRQVGVAHARPPRMRTCTSFGPGPPHLELVGDLDPLPGVDDASHCMLLSLPRLVA